MIAPDEALEDAIMISALQHYSYCPRQCALIHVEQAWDENVYTLRGRAVHEQVDTPESRLEGTVRVERALPLYCSRLELVGRADVVEFLPDGTPFPVEYKHGPRRARPHDDLQLAAQALCLEEMLGRPVPRGAIFHHSSRRRREVVITAALRAQVEELSRRKFGPCSPVNSRRRPPLMPAARNVRCRISASHRWSLELLACVHYGGRFTTRMKRRENHAPSLEHAVCHDSGRLSSSGR